jgi:hypothetical protein
VEPGAVVIEAHHRAGPGDVDATDEAAVGVTDDVLAVGVGELPLAQAAQEPGFGFAAGADRLDPGSERGDQRLHAGPAGGLLGPVDRGEQVPGVASRRLRAVSRACSRAVVEARVARSTRVRGTRVTRMTPTWVTSIGASRARCTVAMGIRVLAVGATVT